jgi:catechol 2,3-dioxygenase-like lactoylglutathione lyase family enzyme
LAVRRSVAPEQHCLPAHREGGHHCGNVKDATMAISFQHVHLKTRDVAATVRYYIDNFGATRKAEIPGRGWQLDLDGTQLTVTGIMTEQNHRQHYGIEHLAVVTDDYAATMATLRGNGVEVLEELTGEMGNRVAFVAATDGVQMEVIEKI